MGPAWESMGDELIGEEVLGSNGITASTGIGSVEDQELAKIAAIHVEASKVSAAAKMPKSQPKMPFSMQGYKQGRRASQRI